MNQTSIELFWSKVEKLATECGCWLWMGYCDENGYGGLTIARQRETAHRVSWRISCGEIPDGLFVCHRCDTPSCVNPNHLFLGNNLDNVTDMVSKDRECRGERSPFAKLTEMEVINIQIRYANRESQESIASDFGVSRSHISDICSGGSWRKLQLSNLPERPKKKLLPRQVLEIKKIADNFSVIELAEKFQVSKWAIYDILNGKRWGELTGITRS